MKAIFVAAVGGFVPQFEMHDVRLLQRKGVEVHYAANFENPVYPLDLDELHSEGIITHHINIQKSPARVLENLDATLRLRHIIQQEQIGLVHCHNLMGALVARLASLWSGRKPYVLYTTHGLYFYQGAPLWNWLLGFPLERVLARCTDRIITINREDRRRVDRFPLRNAGPKEQICGVGVDMERFRKRPERRASMRKALNIPPDAFHIVTAAELNRNKNQAVIIHAIAQLDDAGIYYSLCGEGPEKALLQALIERYGLCDRIRLLGYRNDMPDVLQSADCFAFPSVREGLGIAAVEALACSVPVVASDNRGTREYLRDGFNGIICRENKAEAFAEAIGNLRQSPELCKQLSQGCRESVAPFSVTEAERRMDEIYEEILSCIIPKEEKQM